MPRAPTSPPSRMPAATAPVTERPRDAASALDSIRRVVRVLRLAETETRGMTGVSAAQLFVLRQLAGGTAASLSELATRTMTDRTSVAAVVARLEADGFATSDRDPTDRRRVMVKITGAGRQLLRRAPAPPTEVLVEAIDNLSPSARRQLAHGLRALVRELGVQAGPSPMLFEDEGGPKRWRREA